jgi:hypothetical protein
MHAQLARAPLILLEQIRAARPMRSLLVAPSCHSFFFRKHAESIVSFERNNIDAYYLHQKKEEKEVGYL